MSRRRVIRNRRAPPAGGGSSFSGPASLSGLYMWQKSDVGVTQASNLITNWADQSGNSNDWTAVGAARPLLVASDALYGGKPSISFNGAAQCFVSSAALVYGAFTSFLAFRGDGTIVGFLYSRSAGPDYIYGTTGNTTSVNYAGGGSAYNLSAGWSTNAAARTIARVFDGTHAGDSLRINGVAQTLTSVSAGNPGLTGVSSTAGLMANNVGATLCSGTVAEWILYNRVLSAGEIANVEGYLRARYGYY